MSSISLRSGRQVKRSEEQVRRRSPRRPEHVTAIARGLQNVFKVDRPAVERPIAPIRFSEKIDPILTETFLSKADTTSRPSKPILQAPRRSRLFWPALALLGLCFLIWVVGGSIALTGSSPLILLPSLDSRFRLEISDPSSSPSAGPVMSPTESSLFASAAPVRANGPVMSDGPVMSPTWNRYRNIDF
jgi:hypothetical protein